MLSGAIQCSNHVVAAGNAVVRFQRAVLKKGQLMKRGKAGALFGDRYAVSRKSAVVDGDVQD